MRKEPPWRQRIRSRNVRAAGRWLGFLAARDKRECLNYFLRFSLGHRDHTGRSNIRFFNEHRLSRGLGNRTLPEPSSGRPEGFASVSAPEAVRIRRQDSGGEPLRHDYRAAVSMCSHHQSKSHRRARLNTMQRAVRTSGLHRRALDGETRPSRTAFDQVKIDGSPGSRLVGSPPMDPRALRPPKFGHVLPTCEIVVSAPRRANEEVRLARCDTQQPATARYRGAAPAGLSVWHTPPVFVNSL